VSIRVGRLFSSVFPYFDLQVQGNYYNKVAQLEEEILQMEKVIFRVNARMLLVSGYKIYFKL